MDIYEILDIFANEMRSEIFHYVSDNTLQDILISSIDQAKEIAISTYEANSK